MELKDERRIPASREAVFAALNDPEVLRQCIPGCESLEKLSDTDMAAIVSLKVGPVKARFQGKVVLSNIEPPVGYTITGEGSAGPAGNARGGADVTLVEDGDGTILRYEVKAEIVGKLAQLGGRLIDSTAKMLAGQFFDKFAAVVGGEAAAAATPADAPEVAAAPIAQAAATIVSLDAARPAAAQAPSPAANPAPQIAAMRVATAGTASAAAVAPSRFPRQAWMAVGALVVVVIVLAVALPHLGG